MITEEVFNHLKNIQAINDVPISYDKFLPIRDQISIAEASNYAMEDSDAKKFWTFLDNLIEKGSIHDVCYVMDELLIDTKSDYESEFSWEDNDNAYLKYIIFSTKLSQEEMREIVDELEEEFSAGCFENSDFGSGKWIITWD